MSQRIPELRAEIVALEEELAAATHPRTRARLTDDLAACRAELSALESGGTPEPDATPVAPAPPVAGDAVAGDKVGGDKVAGHKFVATQQTITCYYGTRPPEDAAALLSDYLQHVAAECDALRLQRMTGQRQTGKEQAAVPELRLQAVYTSLTTDGPPVVRRHIRTTVGRLRRFLQRLEDVDRGHDAVPPERVIHVAVAACEGQGTAMHTADRRLQSRIDPVGLDTLADETAVLVVLERPELALEAIARQHRLVLLGEPGSGKSTVLRYLGHLLARRAAGAHQRLTGWPDDETPLPILVPLAQVAEHLTTTPDPDQALWQTLGRILDGPQGLSAGLRDALKDAVRRGGVILLCDGLDELSADGGERSPRTLVAQALQRLATRAHARIVVTSRVLPYQSATTWQLPADAGWQVRTLTPLAFGQVRTFVRAWFQALTDLDRDLTPDAAHQTADALIAQLEDRPALEPLVRSPLLLTMLTLLHDNDGVPENEVALYEQCVVLLLERWEPVRQPGLKRPGLIERLGSPPGLTLARLRDPLHQLAYEAHRDARGEEGRGVISDDLLQGRLTKFFERLGMADPLGPTKRSNASCPKKPGC